MQKELVNWSRQMRQMRWSIGFIDAPIETLLSGQPKVRWIKNPYKDRWFADPFILDYDELHIFLLVEEFCYKNQRGRIARLTINRKDMRCECVDILLDLPTHLSFPFIIRSGNKIYVMPENSQFGALSLYEYDTESNQLVNPKTIIKRPLTDAILVKICGVNYVLTTEIPNQNGNKLLTFQLSDKLDVVSQDEVTFDGNIARCAGDVFTINGVTYRVAQDCTKCYGGAVYIQRIDTIDRTLTFTNINRIAPQGFLWSKGLHTLNIYKDLIVVDGHGYRRPFIGITIDAVATIKRTLFR